MFKISYSPNLKGEITIPGSKNAGLPIVAANYCINNAVRLDNKPEIVDIKNMEILADESLKTSKDFFDLTSELATKFRASILLIPMGLLKYGHVKFVGTGGCKIGKRSLDTFDDALVKAGVQVTDGEFKEYKVIGKPKKNIMLQEFSVTATEALITYLAFVPNVDYDINIYLCATEPHVQNLIDFLKNAGVQIGINVDKTITIKPNSKPSILKDNFRIISDYTQAGTYFAIGAGADNSELVIKDCDVDELSAIYNTATKMGIDFKILDKKTIRVNSKNKANYQSTKFETRTYPGFPTDLQPIFGTLLTQCSGISKIFETLYEGRFGYLNELEKMGAKIEILNPHQAIIIGATKLRGDYVAGLDLRGGGAMVLAGIMADGTTYITDEQLILRGYDNIENILKSIGVTIERV